MWSLRYQDCSPTSGKIKSFVWSLRHQDCSPTSGKIKNIHCVVLEASTLLEYNAWKDQQHFEELEASRLQSNLWDDQQLRVKLEAS